MKEKTKNVGAQDNWIYPSTHKAIEIAHYYGFSYVNSFTIEKSDHDTAKSLTSDEHEQCDTEEKAALLRTYFKDNQPPLPLMIIHERKPALKSPKHIQYSLDVIGSHRSIADATVIKAAYESARAEGYTNLVLEINSIGDKESFTRYTKELTNYFRKNINELSTECRQLFKKSPFAIVTCNHDECQDIKQNMPQPMNYLSEASRTHFMEMLEFIEHLNIPYSINASLINNLDIAHHTIFRILGMGPGKTQVETVAYGFRWQSLAKKMGYKKDIQGVTATLLMPKVPKSDIKPKKLPKPKSYFIQMGQEAKLKSLVLIELLREAKVPIYHSLTKDKLTAQLASAEHLGVPFILIMGQKESMDNTVLVREMVNRSQDTIRMANLADHLKKVLDELE